MNYNEEFFIAVFCDKAVKTLFERAFVLFCPLFTMKINPPKAFRFRGIFRIFPLPRAAMTGKAKNFLKK